MQEAEPKLDDARLAEAGERTPYMAVSRDAIRRNVAEFHRRFPGAEVCYAMKANSEPEVLRTAAASGCSFEAASEGELAILEGLRIPPGRIFYGSAVKPRASVARFARYGVERFACDSLPELEKIAAAAPGARACIRARADDSGSAYPFSEKFGCGPGELPALARAACRLGLRPYAASFHVGSQARDPSAWARAIRALAPALAELHAEGTALEALNIGGGFPCWYASDPDAPCLRQIAGEALAAIGELPYRPRLMAEPGRALVADAAALVAGVIGRAERGDVTWLFLDAGVYSGLFEALACQGSIRYRISRAGGTGGPLRRFSLAGPTGDGLDVVARDALLPEGTAPGDRLVVRDVGAYSLALCTRFNGFPPPEVRFV